MEDLDFASTTDLRSFFFASSRALTFCLKLSSGINNFCERWTMQICTQSALKFFLHSCCIHSVLNLHSICTQSVLNLHSIYTHSALNVLHSFCSHSAPNLQSFCTQCAQPAPIYIAFILHSIYTHSALNLDLIYSYSAPLLSFTPTKCKTTTQTRRKWIIIRRKWIAIRMLIIVTAQQQHRENVCAFSEIIITIILLQQL